MPLPIGTHKHALIRPGSSYILSIDSLPLVLDGALQDYIKEWTCWSVGAASGKTTISLDRGASFTFTLCVYAQRRQMVVLISQQPFLSQVQTLVGFMAISNQTAVVPLCNPSHAENVAPAI